MHTDPGTRVFAANYTTSKYALVSSVYSMPCSWMYKQEEPSLERRLAGSVTFHANSGLGGYLFRLAPVSDTT
jgi:hypothetical protein